MVYDLLNKRDGISWLCTQTVWSLVQRHLDVLFGCDVDNTMFLSTILFVSTSLDWSVKWKTNFLICKMEFPGILYCTFLVKKIQLFLEENEKRWDIKGIVGLNWSIEFRAIRELTFLVSVQWSWQTSNDSRKASDEFKTKNQSKILTNWIEKSLSG